MGKVKYLFLFVIILFFSCVSQEHKTSTSEIFFEDDFGYLIIKSTGEIILTKYNGENSDVIIPEVTSRGEISTIEYTAFRNNKYIENITIPKSVNKVMPSSFAGCTKLKNITYITSKSIDSINGVFGWGDAFDTNPEVIINYQDNDNSRDIFRFNDEYVKVYTKNYLVWTPISWYGKTLWKFDRESIRVLEYNNKQFSISQFDDLELEHKVVNGVLLFYGKIRRNNYIYGYKNKMVIKNYDNFAIIKIDPKDNVIYIGDKTNGVWEPSNFEICSNDNILESGKGSIHTIQELKNGNVYYSFRGSKYSRIYKNNALLVLDTPFDGTFLVNEDESQIAYISSEWGKWSNGGDRIIHYLYINEKLVYKANGFLSHITFSPDGTKLYYIELRQANQNSKVEWYIRGPGIPPVFSGPYDSIKFSFSDNSNYLFLTYAKNNRLFEEKINIK